MYSCNQQELTVNEHTTETGLSEPELVLLYELHDLLINGDIIAVLRPDGLVGWMPGPRNTADPVHICTICGGSGFLSDNMAALITADFRLTNLCPDCSGTGIIEDGQPLEDDALPATQPLPERGALGGAS